MPARLMGRRRSTTSAANHLYLNLHFASSGLGVASKHCLKPGNPFMQCARLVNTSVTGYNLTEKMRSVSERNRASVARGARRSCGRRYVCHERKRFVRMPRRFVT
jgi:hypothetical protein